jgi:predicted metal-dependent peptidase
MYEKKTNEEKLVISYQEMTPQLRAEKDKALRLLEGIRSRLVLRHPFTAALILQTEIIPIRDYRCTSAMTNGKVIFYSLDFMKTQKESEIVFVLAHEIWHCILGHLRRQSYREKWYWNLAIDAEVNYFLTQEGFEKPDDCADLPKLHGKNAEFIYDWLIESKPEAKIKMFFSYDQHSPNENGTTGEVSKNSEKNSNEGSASNQDHNELAVDPEYPLNFEYDKDENWTQRAIEAHTRVERTWGRGTISAAVSAWVAKQLKPRVNWKAELANFVQKSSEGDQKWFPPNRRKIHDGIYMPREEGEHAKLILVLDTSGSMYDLLKPFLTELKMLCECYPTYEVKVIQFDDIVQKTTDHDENNPIQEKYEFTGLGGTNFDAPLEFIKENGWDAPVLFCTDGYGEVTVKLPEAPFMWVLPEPEDLYSAPSEQGKIIRIPKPKK